MAEIDQRASPIGIVQPRAGVPLVQAAFRPPNTSVADEGSYFAQGHAGYKIDLGAVPTMVGSFTDQFNATIGVKAVASIADKFNDYFGKDSNKGEDRLISKDEFDAVYSMGGLLKHYDGMSLATAKNLNIRHMQSMLLQRQYAGGDKVLQGFAGLAAGIVDPANLLLMVPIPGYGGPLIAGNWLFKPIVSASAKQSVRASVSRYALDQVRMAAGHAVFESNLFAAANAGLDSLQQRDHSMQNYMMEVAMGGALIGSMRLAHGIASPPKSIMVSRAIQSNADIARNMLKTAADGRVPDEVSIAANPVNKAAGFVAKAVREKTADQVALESINADMAEMARMAEKYAVTDVDKQYYAKMAEGYERRLAELQKVGYDPDPQFMSGPDEPKTYAKAKEQAAHLQAEDVRLQEKTHQATRNKVLARELSKASWDASDARATNDQRWLADAWRRVFGGTVRFLPEDSFNRFGVYGFIDKKNPGTIFIRASELFSNTGPGMVMVAGHETAHRIRLVDTSLWKRITDHMMQMEDKDGQFGKAFDQVFAHKDRNGAWGALTPSGRLDEVLSTAFGRALESPEFWRNLWKSSPTDARQVLSVIGKAVARARGLPQADARSQTLSESLGRFIKAANEGTNGTLNEKLALDPTFKSLDDFYKPYFDSGEGWYFKRLRQHNVHEAQVAMAHDAILSELVYSTGDVSSGTLRQDIDTIVVSKPGIRLPEGTDPRIWAFNYIVRQYVTPENMESFKQVVKPRFERADFKAAGLLDKIGKQLTPDERFRLTRAKMERSVKLREGESVESVMGRQALATMERNQDGTYTLRILKNNEALKWHERWANDVTMPEDVGRPARPDIFNQQDRGLTTEFLLEHGNDLEQVLIDTIGIENYGPKAARLFEDWLGERSITELHDLSIADPKNIVAAFYHDLVDLMRGQDNQRFPLRKMSESYRPFDGNELPQYMEAARNLSEMHPPGKSGTAFDAQLQALHDLYSKGHTESMERLLSALDKASRTIELEGVRELAEPIGPGGSKQIVFMTSDGTPRVFQAADPKAPPSPQRQIPNLTPALEKLLSAKSEAPMGRELSRQSLLQLSRDPSVYGPHITASQYFDLWFQHYRNEVRENLAQYINQDRFLAGFAEKATDSDVSITDVISEWRSDSKDLLSYLKTANDRTRWDDIVNRYLRDRPEMSAIIDSIARDQAVHQTGIPYDVFPGYENLVRSDVYANRDITIDFLGSKKGSPEDFKLWREEDLAYDAAWNKIWEQIHGQNEHLNDLFADMEDVSFMAGDPELTSPEEMARAAAANDTRRQDGMAKMRQTTDNLTSKVEEMRPFRNMTIDQRRSMNSEINSGLGFSGEPSMKTMPVDIDPMDAAAYGNYVGRYEALKKRGDTMIRMAEQIIEANEPVEGPVADIVRDMVDWHRGQGTTNILETVINDIHEQIATNQISSAKRLRAFTEASRIMRAYGGADAYKTKLDGMLRSSAQKMAEDGQGPSASIHHEILARTYEDAAPYVVFLEQSGVQRAWWNNEYMEALAHFNDTGKTTDPFVRDIHKIIKDTWDYQIGRLNQAGGRVRYLEGRLWQQTHNAELMQAAGFDAWREFVEPRIDWAKTERTVNRGLPFNREKYLHGMYNGFIERMGEPFDVNQSVGNLANTTARRREVYFKTTKDAFHYDMQFGSGDTASSILSQFIKRSEQTVIMENFGGDYKLAVQDIVGLVDKHYKVVDLPVLSTLTSGRPGEALRNIASNLAGDFMPFRNQQGKLGLGLNNTRRIEAILGKLTGDLDHPVDIRTSRAWKSFRNYSMGVAMWGSGISSITDVAHVTGTIKWSGVPMKNVEAAALQSYADLARNPATREALLGHGMGLQALVNSYSRLDSGGLMYRASSWLANTTMKGSGLEMVTRANQMVFADLLSQGMGEIARSGDIPRSFENFLLLHGISKADFSAASQFAGEVQGLQGQRLFPDMIPARNLRERFNKMFVSASTNAAIEPAISTTAYLTGGFPAGTPIGEAFRTFGMFKSYPLTITTKVMNRFGNGYAGHDGAMTARLSFVASAVVLAAGVVSIKNVLRGREPFNPLDPEQWTRQNFHRVFMQAGTGYMSMMDQFSGPGGFLGPGFGMAYETGASVIGGTDYARANLPTKMLPLMSLPSVSEGYKVMGTQIFGQAYAEKYQNMLDWNRSRTGQSSIFQDSKEPSSTK